MRRVLVFGIVAIMLASCAAIPFIIPSIPYARVSEMVAMPASQLDAESPLRGAVTINSVLGGQETNPSITFRVGNVAFREALRQSLAAHAMLAEGRGRYRLDAELFEYEQPFQLGINITVPTTVKYTLIEIEANRVVFQETVSVSPTTPFGASLLADERARIANERSIRENFAQFIELLIQSFGTPAVTPTAS